MRIPKGIPELAIGVAILCCQPACTQSASPPEHNNAAAGPDFPQAAPAAGYTTRIIESEGGTYGYEILQNSKPLIRQTTVPGMPGNQGFTTTEAAGKVAGLVIQKLRNGEMPPSVTPEEMKELGAIE